MIRISRPDKRIKAVVSVPPSKSITNRALIIRALSKEKFDIENFSASDDSRFLDDALERLPNIVDIVDAGTAFRFLTAYLSMQSGNYMLTGSERMRHRPVGELVRALKKLGADIEYFERDNFPPLRIRGKNLTGGELSIDASESSQYISALMLIAPKLPGGLKLKMNGKVFSESYIRLTASIQKHFGIAIDYRGNEIVIPEQEYISKNIFIENDWSSAAFWFMITALADDAEILIKNISLKSQQGDVVVTDLARIFGVQTTEVDNGILLKKTKVRLPDFFEQDFTSCPDLVIPLAVVCAGTMVPFRFTGVKNLRIKESDRLNSIKEEFEKIGIETVIGEDSISVDKFDGKIYNKCFHSHNDHRIVMSLPALSIRLGTIMIDNHTDVSKSYPSYWEQLKQVGFTCDLI